MTLRSLRHLCEPDLDDMSAAWSGMNTRVSSLEAALDSPSTYLADVVNNNVTILTISVPTAAWAASVTTAINSIKTCLVNHTIMSAS